MLKRGDRRICSITNSATLLDARKLHQTPGSVMGRSDAVEEISESLVQKFNRRLLDIQSLIELEAENRELEERRNSAGAGDSLFAGAALNGRTLGSHCRLATSQPLTSPELCLNRAVSALLAEDALRLANISL